ncbi:MAG: succinate dehydrogenase, hydrophobic membrane anchor protein [Pseudobdellovibrionaceae bacterium]
MAYKWEDTAFKGSLSRARGLGSARSGVEHWMHQKMTALANIPLVLWAVCSVAQLARADGGHQVVTSFFAQPFNAVMMTLFLISTLYHAVLGIQVVVEDYIHTESTKTVLLMLVKLLAFALGVAGIFSVLKMAL